MIELPTSELGDCFGIGVAGNFAGHLEQAGEATDFERIDAPVEAPKGIFPFYLPGGKNFLATFPLSADRIVLPRSDEPHEVQIEPEAGVLCDIEYADGIPVRLQPRALGAFNDCSVRRPDARKLSEKKNWGAATKGFALHAFEVEEIETDGATAEFRLTSFLRRGEETHPYGADSALPEYSYYGSTLLDWMIERLQHQKGGEDSPLEPIGEYLVSCGSPERTLIGIGATRYTDFGATNFLQPGDESIVIVYDGAQHDEQAINNAVAERGEADLAGASVLVQAVEAG